MINLLTIIKKSWATLTLLMLAVITLLSLWPLDKLPSAPGSDKLHHLIVYALLMLPVALRKPDRWILFALLFVAYSGMIELAQPYVNRYGEWGDLGANTAGIVCGVIVAEAINRIAFAKPNRRGKAR